VSEILSSDNHFDTLKLRKPTRDALDRPKWDVTADELQRAFRKRTICCHPDKVTEDHEKREKAYDKIRDAREVLEDQAKRDLYIKRYLVIVEREQRNSWTPGAGDLADETKQGQEKRQEAATMLASEASALQSEIKSQMQRHRKIVTLKKLVHQRADSSDSSDSSDSDNAKKKKASAQPTKKPRRMGRMF